MTLIWVKSHFDYAGTMSRDLDADSSVSVVEGVALQSRWSRLAGSVLTRTSPGLATCWSRHSFVRLVGRGLLSGDEERTICLFDSSPFADDPEFLRQLRRRHPGCHLVSISLNTIVDPRRGDFIRNHYDIAYSFDPANARTFGFHNFEQIYSSVNEAKSPKLYDLVFVGADKGRLESLHNLYLMFRSNGVRCFFYVVSDETRFNEDEGFVVSRARISYDHTIALVKSANCILDLVPEYQTGLSLRFAEAVVYRTRLLTNSTSVRASPWFDRAHMSVFDSLDTVDVAFVKDSSDIDADYAGEFSPLQLVGSIRANLLALSARGESGRTHGAT